MVDPISQKGTLGTGSHERGVPTETELRAQTFSRELGGALSALDCVLGNRFGLFASTELGEGRALYLLLAQAGLHRSSELREKLGEKEFRHQVLDPQKAQSMEFSRRLHLRHPEEVVVTPANLHFQGWTSQEYRTFWGTVIRTRIEALYFQDDWEFSESCATDFKIACEVGLPTFDAEGQPLALSDGRFRIQNAILELEADGFDTSGLAASLQNLGRQNRVVPDNQ